MEINIKQQAAYLCLEFRRVPGMSCELESCHHLDQWAPIFSAAETGFMEDIFFSPTDLGRGMVWRWFKHIAFIVQFYFYYYYNDFTSDHQILRGWVSPDLDSI